MSETYQTFHPVVFEPNLAAQASEIGLVMPRVELADKLQMRLGRNERTIEVDQDALWAGTQDAELENALIVGVDALPKTTTNTDPTITYESDRHSLIRIDHNPSAEKGINRKINTAFWLGILVTDALAEGERSNYQKSLIRYGSKGGLLNLASGAVGIGNFAVSTAIGGESREVTIALITAQVSTVTIGLRRIIKSHRMNVNEYIESKKCRQASDLAKKHPVLEYGTSVV